MKKYGFWGFIVFVLIPLPGTGVYAGSIVDYLFGMARRKACLANTMGISISRITLWINTVAALEGIN